jgi:hypothetical protein
MPMPVRRGSRPLLRLLCAAVGAVLAAGCVQPPVLPEAGPTTRARAETPGQNAAAVKRLGGAVDYGHVDRATGQRSGVGATITPAMVRAAAAHDLGSVANPEIRPPGFGQLPARNRSRGHLLGRQLGGSGEAEANLVAMYQRRANSPVMRDYESAVAEAVQRGETVRYRVRPVYPNPRFRGAPSALRITASGNHGFRLDVLIANTPEAKVHEYVPLPPGYGAP